MWDEERREGGDGYIKLEKCSHGFGEKRQRFWKGGVEGGLIN